MAPVSRQLVSDLRGDSGGTQQNGMASRLSSNLAPYGYRKLGQYCEVVVPVRRQLSSDLCGNSGGTQENMV
jgi:hypothetical protein